jgi:hypothetical protein
LVACDIWVPGAKDTEGNTFGMIQPLPGSVMQP